MSATANILIVDDKAENLLALEATLEPLGKRVVRARSGNEALRAVLHDDFAVILLDVQMPDLDGLATASLIKKRERSRYTPIIFLTANEYEMASVLRAYEQGAVDVLFKPFQANILRSKVGVFVDLFEQKERLREQEEQLRRREREQVEREQAEREQVRLNALFQQMPALVGVIHAADRTFALANPLLVDLHGGRPLVGRKFREAQPELASAGLLDELDRVLATGRPYHANALRLEVPRGGAIDERYFDFALHPMTGASGSVDSVILFALEVTERVNARKKAESAEKRIAFLADAGSVLTSSLDYELTLRKMVRLAVPEFADGCMVHMLEEDRSVRRIAAAFRDPLRVDATFAKDESARCGALDVAAVLRTGEPLHLASREEVLARADGADGRAAASAAGLTSAIVVPLVSNQRAIGALTFFHAESTRRYDAADVAFAREVGRRASNAIENARLFEAERRAHERVGRIQDVTSALSEALAPSAVASVMIREGMEAVGADTCALYMDRGGRLELLAHRGVSADLDERLSTLSLDDDLPATRAVRARHTVWVETEEAYRAICPELAGAVVRGPRVAAFACLPLLVDERAIGVLGFGYFAPRTFPRTDRDFFETLARQCAQALERARLYEAEREGRERLALLAEASATLASSLDHESTLKSVARLAVPSLGDLAAFDLLDDEGMVRRIATASAVDGALPMLDRPPCSRASLPPADPTAQALATGDAQRVARMTPEHRRQVARDEEDLARLEALAPTSLIAVPLVVRNTTVGAFTLAFTRERRAHDDDDLRLAEEIARRAAMAIDNARLFKEAQEAVRLRDDFLSIASHELNTPLTPLKMQIAMLRRGIGVHDSAAKLAMADRQVDRMTKLISRLLDVSRIVGGRLALEPEPVNLTAVVREVVAQFRDEAGKQGSELRLSAERDAVGSFDRLRVEQVVTNLVTNAIKYGSGKPIDLELTVEGSTARLIVRDRGIGIEPHMQARIFDRFERAVSSRHYGGFGLGLWIARQIVEASGGRISVQSKPGEGSVFAIDLPIQDGASALGEERRAS